MPGQGDAWACADLDVLGAVAEGLPDGEGQAVAVAAVYDAVQPVAAARFQLDAQYANGAARPEELCGPMRCTPFTFSCQAGTCCYSMRMLVQCRWCMMLTREH